MKYEQNPNAWWYVLPGVVLGAGVYWYLRSGKAAADADAAVAADEEDEAIAAAEDKEDRRTRRKECKARSGPYKWNTTTKQCESKIKPVTHLKQINLKAVWAGQAKADCSKAPKSLRWRCEVDKGMAIGMLKQLGLRAE
jgi:hypothetical protein